jgi:hypothetical protein
MTCVWHVKRDMRHIWSVENESDDAEQAARRNPFSTPLAPCTSVFDAARAKSGCPAPNPPPRWPVAAAGGRRDADVPARSSLVASPPTVLPLLLPPPPSIPLAVGAVRRARRSLRRGARRPCCAWRPVTGGLHAGPAFVRRRAWRSEVATGAAAGSCRKGRPSRLPQR